MKGYFNRSSLFSLGGAICAIVGLGGLLTVSPSTVSRLVGETLISTFLINIGVFLTVVLVGFLLARRQRDRRSRLGDLGSFLFGLGFMAVGLIIWRHYYATAFQAEGAGLWWLVMAGMVVLGTIVHFVGRWLRVNE